MWGHPCKDLHLKLRGQLSPPQPVCRTGPLPPVNQQPFSNSHDFSFLQPLQEPCVIKKLLCTLIIDSRILCPSLIAECPFSFIAFCYDQAFIFNKNSCSFIFHFLFCPQSFRLCLSLVLYSNGIVSVRMSMGINTGSHISPQLWRPGQR